MDRPIRLAHVFSADIGIEATMPYILPVLARGWEVTAISPAGPRVDVGLAAGVRWRPLSIRRSIDPWGDAVGSVQLAARFLADRYDIVHTHNIKVGLMARVLATLTRVPIIVHTMHGLAYSLETPPLPRFVHASLERFASLKVDAILAQSAEDRRTILETGVVGTDRVVLIGNGIDLRRFDAGRYGPAEREAQRQALGVRPDEVLFLSAGRLVREKGYVELFEAARLARTRDARVRLCVAGRLDDDKADAIDRSLVERARDAGVLVLGERADMPPLYAAADVVTLASWREGLPRVLMEGAAFGKPLIATDIRGCREVVRHGHNGLLTKPRDAEALADAMCALAADPGARRRMGREAAAQAVELYDIDKVIDRVLRVYDEQLARRGLTP